MSKSPAEIKNTMFVQVFEAEYVESDQLHQVAFEQLEQYVRCEEAQQQLVQDIANQARLILSGHDFLRGTDVFGPEQRKLSDLCVKLTLINNSLMHLKWLMSKGE